MQLVNKPGLCFNTLNCDLNETVFILMSERSGSLSEEGVSKSICCCYSG
jgi:hypothetical protein